MTIRYKCEECGSVLNIKDEKAGTQGKCPKCKTEFLVPEPDAEAADKPESDEPELALSGEAGRSAPDSSHELAATAPAAGKGSDDFSDDEIERILETGESPKRSGGDSYGVTAGGGDDDDDDELDEPSDEDDEPLALKARRRKPVDFDDDDDDDDDEDERPRSKSRKGKPSREPAATSAGLAKNLMARGDKGVKEERRSKRPFGGGGEHEGDGDDEGFSLKEKAGYLARFAVPGVVALLLAIGFYVWYMRGWQRGDLPELASVSGIVTLDGKPLPKAEIQFIPQQQDPNKPSMRVSSSQAITDDKGEFVLGYNLYAQGAVLGKHRVQIICYSQEGKQIVPSQYNIRSELYREIKAGANKESFELKSSTEGASSAVGGFNPNP